MAIGTPSTSGLVTRATTELHTDAPIASDADMEWLIIDRIGIKLSVLSRKSRGF